MRNVYLINFVVCETENPIDAAPPPYSPFFCLHENPALPETVTFFFECVSDILHDSSAAFFENEADVCRLKPIFFIFRENAPETVLRTDSTVCVFENWIPSVSNVRRDEIYVSEY